jgi:type IV secretion system protein VirB9
VAAVGTTPVSEPTSKSHSHHHHHRDPGAQSDGLVQNANAQARSFPTSSAYVNSTLFYDFEPGRLYQVETSPRFLTAIMLKPGEKLISKASGDTVRWVMGETAEGAGPTARVIILIKPIQGGLRTNMVLSTDQRTYLIEASSREGSTYSSALSWNYPRDEMQALAVAQARSADMTVAGNVSLDQLHFGYRIEPQQSRAPRWQPVRAFDDGTKTYIQFPANMAATDAPPLFLVGAGGKAELVNYRYLNGYYVVDRLIDVAELRLGEKTQTIVRITRTKDRG